MEYYWIKAEVAGGLGLDIDYDPRRTPALVGPLHFAFSDWLGDDIVTTSGYWIITERLSDALSNSGLTGWSLNEVVVSTDDSWKQAGITKQLPSWLRLMPTGVAGRDDFGIKNRVDLMVSERSLDFLKQFTLNQANIFPVSESPNEPPKSPAIIEFERMLRERGAL